MTNILKDAKKYCVQLLSKSRCNILPFHNLKHTTEVFGNTMKIGAYEKIAIDELEPVLLAALFHDTGNAEIFRNHEHFSIEQAMKFLQENNYSHKKITMVLDCIEATRVPQKPRNTFEKIICDADLYHLGTLAFRAKNKALRREWSKFLAIDYSDKDWLEMNLKFLDEHRYFTAFGKDFLEPVKQENIKVLKSQLKVLEQV